MKKTKSQIMQGVEYVSSKVVANNTIEYIRANGDRVIRLHHTDIVTFKENGDIVLNTGGWKTVTTKDRINKFLPSHQWITTIKGQWILTVVDKSYQFADDMTIKADGTIEGAGEFIDVKAITKRIKKYVNDYMIELEAGHVPAPSMGDCFYCQFQEVGSERMAGEAVKNTSHLESHFDEKYYVPSLLAQAIKVFPVSNVAQWYLSDKWGNTNNHIYETFARQQLKKSLYRFIKRQYGLQA